MRSSYSLNSHLVNRTSRSGPESARRSTSSSPWAAATHVFLCKRYLDRDLPDPAGLDLPALRPIRDEIARRIAQLVDELGQVPATSPRPPDSVRGIAEAEAASLL
jgi:hypothetical protein